MHISIISTFKKPCSFSSLLGSIIWNNIHFECQCFNGDAEGGVMYYNGRMIGLYVGIVNQTIEKVRRNEIEMESLKTFVNGRRGGFIGVKPTLLIE